jgi:hypothetical protein
MASLVVATLSFAAVSVTNGQPGFQSGFYQEMLKTGQNVAPVYEGWEANPDGTFNLVFGYFNRNWEEQPDIPIGPDNNIEPGGPDQGQPAHFFPRRNKFVFRVPIPKDFGNKELVWTLTVNGKTERAYGTLKPDYKLEKQILQTNASMLLTVPDMEKNNAPVVRLEGDTHRNVRVGEPLALTASVTDDGLLKPRAARSSSAVQDTTAVGLRVAWFVYRGAGKVAFEPEQFKVYQDKKPGGNSPWTPGWATPPVPADGKFPVTVTFGAPGTYVVRVMAHDGGLQDTKDVTVTVNPPTSASAR